MSTMVFDAVLKKKHVFLSLAHGSGDKQKSQEGREGANSTTKKRRRTTNTRERNIFFFGMCVFVCPLASRMLNMCLVCSIEWGEG